jgi:gas vesicle protein
MSDNNNNFGSFFSGLLFGGAVGAVIALLYAPQSGEEPREFIKEKSVEINDTINSTLEETYAQAQAKAEEYGKLAEEYAKLAKEKGEEIVQKGQVVLNEQKSRFTKTSKEVADELSEIELKDEE